MFLLQRTRGWERRQNTFVQTLAVPGDPALDDAVLGSGLQDELVEVVGPGHDPCPAVVGCQCPGLCMTDIVTLYTVHTRPVTTGTSSTPHQVLL